MTVFEQTRFSGNFMKKTIITLLSLMIFASASFASELTDLLEKAKNEYSKGNLTETINLIDSAKKIVEKENINSSSEEYIEVINWDVVKLKKDAYIGKKVKVTTMYSGLSGSEYIILSISGPCHFDSNLVDKILSLKKFSNYTFYGTVQDSWTSPTLFVERID
jgi:hypothetical protein